MTTINAKIVADSKNEFGNRLTTMLVTFPRYILAELNTHRMLSKNSASSRAIPFEKMVESVRNNPFIPIAWQKDHKGMQGTEYITDIGMIKLAAQIHLDARDYAVTKASQLNNLCSVTKQLCNRILEPFMWHTVLISGTEWENFFALRCPQYVGYNQESYRSKKDFIKDAQFDIEAKYLPNIEDTIEWLKLNKGQADIHMMALAEAIWDALNESTPKQLKAGEWHIPFGDSIDFTSKEYADIPEFDEAKDWQDYAVKIATAKCAQTSYTIVGEDGKETPYDKLIILHDRLAKMGHWSPFEHCAHAMGEYQYTNHIRYTQAPEIGYWKQNGWSGNFRGFIQYRKMFEGENIV